MSDENKKSGLAIALVALLVVLGAGAYFFAKNKTAPVEGPTLTTEATTDQSSEPIVTGEVPPQPETPQNVVVETKQLAIPGEEQAAPTTQLAEESARTYATPEVTRMMTKRSIGNPNAPIKITEYASLTCSHCAHFHNDQFADFKSKFIDTNQVELTFKEFPLNAPAVDASMVLRCMPEDKYVSFMSLLYSTQDKWAYQPEYKDLLRQNAKLAGMSDADFDACLANNDLKEAIVGDMKHASDAYKIQSTPSFVINNGQKTLVGAQPNEMFEKTFSELKLSAIPAAPAPAETPAAAPAVSETPAAAPTDTPADASEATEVTPEPTPAPAPASTPAETPAAQ